MSIEAGLKTYLTAQTTITGLTGTRIYRGHSPQGTAFPKIIINRITGGYEHELSGGSGIAQPTVQIACQAATYGAAKAIADAVRLKLQGFSGTMGSTTVRVATLENEVDIHEPPTDGEQQGVHQVILDYRIWYLQTAPSL